MGLTRDSATVHRPHANLELEEAVSLALLCPRFSDVVLDRRVTEL
jgi:hypothetical protein